MPGDVSTANVALTIEQMPVGRLASIMKLQGCRDYTPVDTNRFRGDMRKLDLMPFPAHGFQEELRIFWSKTRRNMRHSRRDSRSRSISRPKHRGRVGRSRSRSGRRRVRTSSRGRHARSSSGRRRSPSRRRSHGARRRCFTAPRSSGASPGRQSRAERFGREESRTRTAAVERKDGDLPLPQGQRSPQKQWVPPEKPVVPVAGAIESMALSGSEEDSCVSDEILISDDSL